MKKLISTCIVLAILRITYLYAEIVGVYQTEVIKGEMINIQNDVWIDAVAIAHQSDWSGVRRLIKMSNNRREYGKAIDIYYPLLAEYERAWKDKEYYDEYGFIMSDYRFRSLSNSFGYKELCFALADLADDGSVELVIGVKSDGKYIICTIYSYDGDSIYCADTGADGVRTLYETGIYEVFAGMRGVALFDYYQFKKDLQQAEFVIGLTQSYEDEKYYKYMEPENSDNIEITEEEFREIREQYERNLIELDWQELEGYALNLVTKINGDYPEAEPVTETVMKTADMYMEEAQFYIRHEDYLAAIKVLMEGIEKTGDAVLVKKENDLREHIIIIKEKKYKDGKLSEEIEYNKDGNRIKDIEYNKRPDRIVSWSEYEYDSMGNEVKWTLYNASGEIDAWSEDEYDENDNIVTRHIYGGDETEVYEYEYDEAGNTVKEAQYYYFDDKNIGGWYEYEYDDIGNQTKIVRYDYDGRLEYWIENEYGNDENGSWKKSVHYNWNGSIQYWDEYEYNKEGRFTKNITYDGDGRINEWQEFEYNEEGNCTKYIRCYGNGNIEEWYEYEHDGTGGIKTIYYNSDGSIMFWEEREYEYDEWGNLVKSRLVSEGHTTECRFDAFENLVEIKKDGEVSDSYEYEYAYAD